MSRSGKGLLHRVVEIWASVRYRKAPLFPLLILLAVLFTAVFAPYISPHSPTKISLPEGLKPPFWQDGGTTKHLLGTDRQGRDILSRIIWGARVSVTVSMVAIAVGGGVGVAIGIISGYLGGRVDSVLMRVVDIALALPVILIALALAVVFGPSFLNVLLIIAFLLWSRFARLVRGEVLSIKQRDYVALAKVAGASAPRIMLRHVLPNVANTIIVMATLQVGSVILMEASLSFLGAGIPPPRPAWGVMVAEGSSLISVAWWISFFPGLAIGLTVLSMNLLGDWLRDMLDPTLRQI